MKKRLRQVETLQIRKRKKLAGLIGRRSNLDFQSALSTLVDRPLISKATRRKKGR
jgi:hypothetical protein